MASPELRAERALTLLDAWSQTLVPTILLQQARSEARQGNDFGRTATLERRVRRGLWRVEEFEAEVAHEPMFQDRDLGEVRALRASAAAWTAWASALLNDQRRTAERINELEGKAIRLHQAAYAVVDASLRAALQVPSA